MSFRHFLALLMLAAYPSSALAEEPAVGRYRLTGVEDAASELELTADGHFRYYLIYGALDEMAEGDWRRDGSLLLLTTRPAPVSPQFLLKSARLVEERKLFVQVTGPDGEGIPGIDIAVQFDDGSQMDGYTQQDGWQLDIPAGKNPESLTLSIPMYSVQSPGFPLNISGANMLDFLLQPNDLGTADFRDLPLDPGDNHIEMLREGARLRYERVD